MKTLLVITALSLTLTGCGGGSTASPADNSQAIQDAVKTIADKTPASKKYVGAFVTLSADNILPTAQGFVAGNDEHSVVVNIMNNIVSQPTKYPAWYSSLLSEHGITIRLAGDQVGVSAINGLPLYAPDSVFGATLRPDGLHVVQIN